MPHQCFQCQTSFVIEDRDLAFYEKVSPVFNDKKYLVPPPKMCPDCRQQRRQAFRNERKIYNNTCLLCKTNFLSIYSPDKKSPVYCAPCWWSDKWDALSYGRDFDFSRPFFEQWKDLWNVSPKLGIMTWGDNVNCDFANDLVKSKNGYLIFDGEQAEDCYYGETFNKIKDCVDFLFLRECELCFESINCINCYNLENSRFCQNCSDSYFLLDCVGCKNCFGCCNLQQKQYYIFNKPYSKEEYEKIIASFEIGNYSKREEIKNKVETFFASQPKRAYRGQMNENVTGNNLNNCQNVSDCFDCNNVRDSKFCTNVMVPATDCHDTDGWGDNTNLVFNSAMAGLSTSQVIASHYICFNVHDIYHSAFCWQGCNNLFGCVGLIHKEYCILNKQYTKEEYEALVPKIIAHMQNTGEWGDFFPPQLSTFGYNESVANEYFPLSKDQALAKGFLWSDFESPRPEVKKVLKASELRQDIALVDDDICDYAIECTITNRLFRIVKPELAYYKKKNIPLPHRHPDQRHTDRMNLRPPRKLWNRNCAQCTTSLQTPYNPERAEKILCENCYLQKIY